MFAGNRIAVAYSGGPDATALAARLQAEGAHVTPVYVSYRGGTGGKTAKDLKAAKRSAQILGLPTAWIDSPLVKRIESDAKSMRNRIILAEISRAFGDKIQAVGIGTFQEIFAASGQWTEESNDDINPDILAKALKAGGHKLVTWDTFGVHSKADQFRDLSAQAQDALFATTSCQMWWKVECGNCYSCLERHAAFVAAFGKDPTKYRSNSRVGRGEIDGQRSCSLT
jgi:7-cyano-7-deazaguanine synthase in queuosine biosynthesis